MDQFSLLSSTKWDLSWRFTLISDCRYVFGVFAIKFFCWDLADLDYFLDFSLHSKSFGWLTWHFLWSCHTDRLWVLSIPINLLHDIWYSFWYIWVSALSQLRSYLGGNGLFESFQSGFCRTHSTETAILHVVNDILLSMDSGSMNISILLHLSSAFATVCHDLLILLLFDIGITGSALSWLISYTRNRKFFVTLQGYKSTTAPLTQGVPQGSVLCPLLFIKLNSLLTVNKQQIRKSGVWGKSCN